MNLEGPFRRSRTIFVVLAILGVTVGGLLFVFLDPTDQRKIAIEVAVLERNDEGGCSIRLESGHSIRCGDLESLDAAWLENRFVAEGDTEPVGVIWEDGKLTRLLGAWDVLYPRVLSGPNPLVRGVDIGALPGELYIYRKRDFEMWRKLERLERYHCSYWYVFLDYGPISGTRIGAIRQRPEPLPGTREFDEKDFVLERARVDWSSEHRRSCGELLAEEQKSRAR